MPADAQDYAVEEIEMLIKPTDIDPCALLRTEELGASALFDLTRVSCIPYLFFPLPFSYLLTDGRILF